MSSFIKFFTEYYYPKVLRRWYVLLVLVIPALIGAGLSYASLVDSNAPSAIKDFFNTLPFYVWISIIFFFVLIFILFHIKALYDFWSITEQEGLDIGLGDSYEDVIEKIEKFLPQHKSNLKRSLSKAEQNLLYPKKHHDLKVSVQQHYYAYRIINDCLVELFSGGWLAINITPENTELRGYFDQNFQELAMLDSQVGSDTPLSYSEHQIRELIDQINANLNSIFSRL